VHAVQRLKGGVDELVAREVADVVDALARGALGRLAAEEL